MTKMEIDGGNEIQRLAAKKKIKIRGEHVPDYIEMEISLEKRPLKKN